MKIAKIINNNVVSTCDEEGREIIVMGRGVGFKAKEGSTIDEEKVEKIFRLESQNTMDKFKELLGEPSHGACTDIGRNHRLCQRAFLNRPINPNVYITLTDHINFALERYKQKMMFSNPSNQGGAQLLPRGISHWRIRHCHD